MAGSTGKCIQGNWPIEFEGSATAARAARAEQAETPTATACRDRIETKAEPDAS